MSTRLISRVQAQHPTIHVRACVRATSNPSWLNIACFAGFAAVSFVLRVMGFDFEQSLVLAVPGFVVTYLVIVRRFYVVGTDNDIHLLRRGLPGFRSSTDEGPVTMEEIEIIEQSMIVDRWFLGAHELAILKRNRRSVVGMVTHVEAGDLALR